MLQQLNHSIGQDDLIPLGHAALKEDAAVGPIVPHFGDDRLAREDVFGETRANALEARRIVAGEVTQDGPSGETEGTQAVQDRPVEAARAQEPLS